MTDFGDASFAFRQREEAADRSERFQEKMTRFRTYELPMSTTKQKTSAWTYGPVWHWTYHPVTNRRIALVAADGETDILLCTGDDSSARGEVSEEHARLIAAAPDLLAALKDLSDSLNGLLGASEDHEFKGIRASAEQTDAAIAKAEGRA